MNKGCAFSLLLVLSLTACGASEVTDVGDESTTTQAATERDAGTEGAATAPADPPATEPVANATTCEAIVDEYMVSVAGVMTAIGDAGFAELDSEEPPSWADAGEAWLDAVQELAEQSDDAGCSPEVVEQLICARQPDLEPGGDAALHFLSESLPCGVEGTVGEEEADAYLVRLHERSDHEYEP